VPLHGANRQRPTNSKGVDMNKVSGIYRIDLGNGHFYIGSAVDLGRREREHRKQLQRGGHHNQIMQNCWNKYGVFEFAVLEECDKDFLLQREQTYLDKWLSDKKNVNVSLIAGSPMTGRLHSAESRAKIVTVLTGRVCSAETKQRISAALTGVPKSTDACINNSDAQKNSPKAKAHRAALAAARTGVPLSAEIKEKISAALKGIPKSDEHRENMSAALKGIPKSDEHRANISAAWARRRAG